MTLFKVQGQKLIPVGMDQGQTYLNLVLDHKADVLLEYLEKTNKPLYPEIG